MSGRLEWMDDALCVETDPEAFLPEQGGPGGRAARAVCRRCAVTEECLRFALVNGFEGIYGGTSTRERRGMARTRAGVAR
ncbi:WhiB family transcriptional regulator [Actinokineospora inagensis]|uniref:WhiB family transcriptional regulator n=1 Tax=Actinokineospora inagensis TaxID=103730 RepID=UPI000551CF4F|nr:WhiB family transcriptional regulator [Actinokineospora inagensis]